MSSFEKRRSRRQRWWCRRFFFKGKKKENLLPTLKKREKKKEKKRKRSERASSSSKRVCKSILLDACLLGLFAFSSQACSSSKAQRARKNPPTQFRFNSHVNACRLAIFDCLSMYYIISRETKKNTFQTYLLPSCSLIISSSL